MPTAARSTSGGSRVAEGARSSKSASSMAPPNLRPIGVGGPIASTHVGRAARWRSTPVMDGPSFGYLVRTFKAASAGSSSSHYCICERFLFFFCTKTKLFPSVMRTRRQESAKSPVLVQTTLKMCDDVATLSWVVQE